MVSIRQDFWLHDGHQAILGKERRGFFKAMKVKLLFLFALILVVFLCAVCLSSFFFPKTLAEILLSSYLVCYHREQGKRAAASQETLLEERYLLTDAGIACQCVGILLDSKLRGCCAGDFQHCTPLAEVSTIFLVLSTAFSQPIQPCRGRTMLHWELALQRGTLESTVTPAKAASQVSHPYEFCCMGYSLGSLDLSYLGWWFLHLFLLEVLCLYPAVEENRNGYRKVGIGLILTFLPMSSLPLKANC